MELIKYAKIGLNGIKQCFGCCFKSVDIIDKITDENSTRIVVQDQEKGSSKEIEIPRPVNINTQGNVVFITIDKAENSVALHDIMGDYTDEG